MTATSQFGPMFSEGDRVLLSGQTAVVLEAFPDGFHTLRLETNGQLTGAHRSQMSRVERCERPRRRAV